MKNLVLVTGAAGFIGSHVCRRLLSMGYRVWGVDSCAATADFSLKLARLESLSLYTHFSFKKLDIVNFSALFDEYSRLKPDYVIHLAAQTGVRFRPELSHDYGHTNIMGFLNVLECVRRTDELKHLLFASSSSVYGASEEMPFSKYSDTDRPLSIYAATKKSNELMAHSYSHMFQIPITGLRFFSVYGPWARPDMVLSKFTKNILSGKAIKFFNYGNHFRDFTFIDDVVECIVLSLQNSFESSGALGQRTPRYRLYNVGTQTMVSLKEVVSHLENLAGKKAVIELCEHQVGDIFQTQADMLDFQNDFNFRPKTPFAEGVQKFYSWYRSYYKEESQNEIPLGDQQL